MINASKTDMEPNDTQLVSASLNGSREAFGRIVAQYQSLICSLAYSATGSLTQSEDVAQETFVIAWQQLRQLREPAKLRAWLCSIARSVISRATRRQLRQPAHGAETLDTAQETSSADPIPSDRAIHREEEAILWRSLEQIPKLYREPLILFYREQQSVAAVAAQLELSEDAVKQRLSRGRKLLTEEVTAFVEGTLERTAPGKAFTLGVLAALPVFTISVTSAKAAALGTTAKTGAAAKATAAFGLAGWCGVFFGPVIGLLGGLLQARMNIDQSPSPHDRQFRIKMAWISTALALAFGLLMFVGMFYSVPRYEHTHPVWIICGVIALTLAYVFLLSWLVILPTGRQRRLAMAVAASLPAGGAVSPGSPAGGWFYEYRSPRQLLGWPLIHLSFGRKFGQPVPAKGWIACGDVAIGILFAGGGAAVGGVAIGTCAIGGVAVGGSGIGCVACGGAAVAWLAGFGGAVVARHYAYGGAPIALHAVWLPHGWLYGNLLVLLSCLPMLPNFLHWRKQARRQPATR